MCALESRPISLAVIGQIGNMCGVGDAVAMGMQDQAMEALGR